MTGVGCTLKSRKLVPHFIGPYQIMNRVEEVAYKVSLLPFILNIHDVFHVSQPRKYTPNMSHVIQVDDVQVREDLTIEASPLRLEDHDVKSLIGNEIALVKVVWGGPAEGSMT